VIPRAEVVAHWPVAALLCPLVFAAIAPAAWRALPEAQFAALAQLPVVMAHQAFAHAGGARTATAASVALGTWGAVLAAFLLGAFVHPGWGLAAPYLLLAIGAAHAAAGLRGRNDPGVRTALALLLPAGAAGVLVIGAAPGVAAAHHLAGIAAALALHGMGRVVLRRG
jgi:hypothetical protein